MCDHLITEIASLAARGVQCSAIEEARWGSIATVALRGGGQIALYQPRHPLAIDRAD